MQFSKWKSNVPSSSAESISLHPDMALQWPSGWTPHDKSCSTQMWVDGKSQCRGPFQNQYPKEINTRIRRQHQPLYKCLSSNRLPRAALGSGKEPETILERITHRECEEIHMRRTHVYVRLIHFAVLQKLAQRCKATRLQKRYRKELKRFSVSCIRFSILSVLPCS